MSTRLHLMLTGTIRQSASFDARPAPGARVTDDGWPFSGGRTIRVPVPAFAIEHPEAGVVLVDTGLHPGVAEGARRNVGALCAFFMDPRTGPGCDVRTQLARRGVDPARVERVVLTHLHADHASAVSEFPAATFVLDRREWEVASASEGDPAYHPPQFDLPVAWDRVDFDGPRGRRGAGFDRAVDLLGDGSVVLVSTPGHSAGHLSVLVRLPGRDVLLAGDAALTSRALDGAVPMYLHDESQFRSSIAQIRAWARAHPRGRAIPGHDAAAWERLAPVYP